MAFFGLTVLGSQEPLKKDLLDNLDINIFNDYDFEDAFNRTDKDKSGYIDHGELEIMLETLMHGEVPKREIDRFFNEFDTNKDGRISREEFFAGLKKLKQDAEVEQANLKQKNQYTSWNEMQEDRKKHRRNQLGPTDITQAPPTSSNEFGFDREDDDIRQKANRGITSCPEVLYACEMTKAGVSM
jgi:hypothetical protein